MKKIIAFFVSLVLSFTVFSVFACALGDSARSAVLIEAASGEIIFSKDENTRRGMASTTKIMTAIVAIENSSLDKVVNIRKEAVGVEGSSIYLTEGEKITMRDLLYALMLQSANDAAAAIAYEVAGSIDGFADMMNKKAEELGLTNTHFDNPHGLDGDTHYTTAYELAVIAAYALKNETFRTIVSTVKKSAPANEKHVSRLFVNHNRLLRTYDDVIGVKTGFTKKCGRTLVSAAERDGLRLICVTLDDGNDWKDHREMLDYGFSLYENVVLTEKDGLSFSVPLVGGEKKSVTVKNAEGASAALRKNHGEIESAVYLPRFIYAGTEKGTAVGKIKYFTDGKIIGESELYLAEDAPIKYVKKGFFKK